MFPVRLSPVSLAVILVPLLLGAGLLTGKLANPWPTPAQIFADVGTPTVNSDNSRTWRTADRRLVVEASQARITIDAEHRAEGLPDAEMIDAISAVTTTLCRVIDNSLSEWVGAGKSVLSASAAMQDGDQIILYHADRRVLITGRMARCRVVIERYPPKQE